MTAPLSAADRQAIQARVERMRQGITYPLSRLADDFDTLLAEIKRLKAEAEKLDRQLTDEIDDRTQADKLLDQFAYTIAPISAIGEHSSGNDPWANALDMVTPAAEVDQLTAQVEQLRTIRTLQAMWEKLGVHGLPVEKEIFAQCARDLGSILDQSPVTAVPEATRPAHQQGGAR